MRHRCLALSVFDAERRWEELGYASLFDFLRRELKLSAGAAQNRKAATGLIARFPEVEAALRRGDLCLRRLLDKLAAARDAPSHSHPGASEETILEVGLDLIIDRHRKRRGIGAKPRKRGAAASGAPVAAGAPAPVGERGPVPVAANPAPGAATSGATVAASAPAGMGAQFAMDRVDEAAETQHATSPPPPRRARSRHVPAADDQVPGGGGIEVLGDGNGFTSVAS